MALLSCVSVNITKKLSENVDIKLTIKGVVVMEMIRNMGGCGTFRDGSIWKKKLGYITFNMDLW